MKIIYRDEWIVAINKPSGLLVHPTKMAKLATGSLRDQENCLSLLRNQLGRWIYPVHRLDRAASGVLLFALSREVASQLARQFREKTVQKTYCAIVRGIVSESGVIDKPLRKTKESEYVPAVTRFRRLASIELPFAIGRYPTFRYSLVEVETETGRLHQIRKHFQAISHPLIGDTVYGEGRHNRFFRERYGVHRLLLFAERISFRHPQTRQGLGFYAEWPEEFSRFAEFFGFSK